MAKMRPPQIPGNHVPMLSDDHVRLLLADCFGRDFRNRRDCATIRPFLDSGMRLEDMSGPRHTADDPELSSMELTSRMARVTVKGRCEQVLPIGAKTPPDIDIWNMVSEGLLAVGVLP